MSELPQSQTHDAEPMAPAERAETEQEQSELDLGVISTGSGPVDQSLKPLETLSREPVGEHPAVFEQVLTDLSATMSDGPTSGDAGEPSADGPDDS